MTVYSHLSSPFLSLFVDEQSQQSATEEPRKSLAKTVTIIIGWVIGLSFIITLTLFLTGTFQRTVKRDDVKPSCRSRQCQEANNRFEKMLAKNSSACEDFFQYSCGGWLKADLLVDTPVDTPRRTWDNDVLIALNSTFHEYVLGSPAEDDLYNVISFYRSCHDFVSKEVPIEVLQRRLFRSMGLPSSPPSKTSLDLFDDVVHISLKNGIDTLFSISVVEYNGEPMFKVAPGKSIEKRLLHSTEQQAYYDNYMTDFIGAINKAYGAQAWDNMLHLDLNFRFITDLRGDDLIEAINVTSLPTVPNKITIEHWINAINRGANVQRPELGKQGTIVVENEKEILAIIQLIFNENPADLWLYLMLQISVTLLQFRFNPLIPHLTCIRLSRQLFRNDFLTAVSKLYVGESRIKHFRTFYERVRAKVVESLASAKWLDQVSRQVATKQVESAKLLTVAAQPHSPQPNMSWDFIKNYVSMLAFRKRSMNVDLEHKLSSADVEVTGEAELLPDVNVITVPIAFLMPPAYFDVDDDDFVNYSVVGTRLVELMTLVTAEDKALANWAPQTRTDFEERATCFGDLFSQLTNGTATDAEQNFTYQKQLLYSTIRALSLTATLADLRDRRATELFFGRFCQWRCRIDFDKEPALLPARPFCNFAVRNVPLFFETFKCNAIDIMQPIKACKVM
ncbi:uncharacterized protein LOC135399945 isoform X2 [Ornithodoros turicata]|uniref:uncharacterized protein LOC135399945 isoform X2 n=1 Tax=Ornithodoros turicata TaxID=34597 RepID=UPI003138C813